MKDTIIKNAVKLLEKVHDTYDEKQNIWIDGFVGNHAYVIEGAIYNDKTKVEYSFDLPTEVDCKSEFFGTVTVIDENDNELFTDELTIKL